jgi:hypothetical protein
LRNINIKIEDERYSDLEFLQKYYSERGGAKISMTQAVKICFFETANRIKHAQRMKEEEKENEK